MKEFLKKCHEAYIKETGEKITIEDFVMRVKEARDPGCGDDQFFNDEVGQGKAVARAQALGCEGTHLIPGYMGDASGSVGLIMPCSTHAIWRRKREIEEAKNTLAMLTEAYLHKRRGKDSPETFEEIEKSFIESVKILIPEKHACLEESFNKPFMKELFQKYNIEATYIVEDIETKKSLESKSLDELKEKNIDCSNYKIVFNFKEAEKKFHDFIFFKQWWKPKFIEGKPMDRYVIATSSGLNVYVDDDIFTDSGSIKESKTMYFMATKNLMDKITEGVQLVSPKTAELNNTLMPCWTKLLGHGQLCYLSEAENEVQFEFKGNNVNGIYKATKNGINSDFWSISKIS